MSTAQGGTVSSVLYVVVLVVSLRPAYRATGGPAAVLRRPHPVAVLLWLVVAVPSLAELAWPPIYGALSRQPTAVEHGQLWRLLTSITVQDGGVPGTVFNLVALALTVPVAVALVRPAATAGLFLAGTLVFNLPATFVWHQAGGGNSGATFFLATSLLGLLVAGPDGRPRRAPAAAVAVIGIVLLLLGDAHSEAVLAGLVVGVGVGVAALRRGPAAPSRG